MAKLKNIFNLFFLFIVLGCESNTYNCNLDPTILAKNDSILKNDAIKFYQTIRLKSINEPRLQALKTKSFRLYVSYSFDKDIWIYRFQKTKTGGTLILKKTYSNEFKKRTNISDSQIHKKLTLKEWLNLEKVFESNCFWTMPVEINRQGLDGENYIVEAFDPNAINPINKTYFLIYRWSFNENSDAKTIIEYIQAFDRDQKK